MTESDILGGVAELINRNRELEKKLERCIAVDKFYNTALTTEDVAKLHGVSAGIVRKYIDLGLIEKHPMSTDGKWLVRGSVALSLDFDKLKKEAKFLRY